MGLLRSMFKNVSSFKTEGIWAIINLKIWDHSVTTAPIDGFIKDERRGGKLGEQGTPHAQLDVCGITPMICSLAGVASIHLFPEQIFL